MQRFYLIMPIQVGWNFRKGQAGVSIKREVKETVGVVQDLLSDGRAEVTQTEIGKLLKLDKSVVSRRVNIAKLPQLLRKG